MCVYCMTGDFQFRHNPPWWVPPETPFVPRPLIPQPAITDWDLTKLREYLDLLKRIKAMEDQLGCPCEPNKADYIGMFEQRIAELERIAKERAK